MRKPTQSQHTDICNCDQGHHIAIKLHNQKPLPDAPLEYCTLLSPRITVLLEKLMVAQLVKILPAFYGTQSIDTIFAKAHNSILY